jgi:long-chain acyl-CoA synthetase
VKYGEVVGAFLLPSPQVSDIGALERPTDEDIRAWVGEFLGRHKIPAHIFWFGDDGVGLDEVPQTGSGKVKKHILRAVAQRLANSTERKVGQAQLRHVYNPWPSLKECTF